MSHEPRYRKALVEPRGPAQSLLTRNVVGLLTWTGYRQADLADALGISQGYISQLLRGLRPWQVEHLDRLSTFFRVSIPSLFIEGGEQDPLPFERRSKHERRSGTDRRRRVAVPVHPDSDQNNAA